MTSRPGCRLVAANMGLLCHVTGVNVRRRVRTENIPYSSRPSPTCMCTGNYTPSKDRAECINFSYGFPSIHVPWVHEFPSFKFQKVCALTRTSHHHDNYRDLNLNPRLGGA